VPSGISLTPWRDTFQGVFKVEFRATGDAFQGSFKAEGCVAYGFPDFGRFNETFAAYHLDDPVRMK
jgi:hypothetical protein